MSVFIGIVITVIIVSAFYSFAKKYPKPEPLDLTPAQDTQAKSESAPAQSQETNQEKNTTADTAALLISTLKSMGCQPEQEENGMITVKYQGEFFHCECFDYFVRVWDPTWAKFNLADPSAVPTQQAVNDANFNPGPAIVMAKPNADGDVAIHSHWTIVFHPAIPYKDAYLDQIFNQFFAAKRNLAESRNEILEKYTKIAQN